MFIKEMWKARFHIYIFFEGSALITLSFSFMEFELKVIVLFFTPHSFWIIDKNSLVTFVAIS